ncbi:MAG: hypothetical protein LBB88_08550 [Planctomycetaceae bacterium]|nr:hypothetical protein [Planctomycetaceae bacterium]
MNGYVFLRGHWRQKRRTDLKSGIRNSRDETEILLNITNSCYAVFVRQ